MTRIAAVFFEHDDILLAGVREEGVPFLDLDQFVVALRNAFAAGKEYEGVIGCTMADALIKAVTRPPAPV